MRLRFVFCFTAVLTVLCAASLRAEAPPSLQSNLMNPLIGLTGMFKGEASTDRAKESGERYGFGLQAAELSIESVVDQHFKLNANLVFADDEVGAEEVYATTRSLPQVQVKVGKFKASFGKLGTVHAHAFPFILQALPYEKTIGGEGFNGGGVEAAWMTPLPWFLELTGGGFSAMEQGESPRDWSGSRKDDFVYQARAKNFFDLGADSTLEAGASALSGHTALGETQSITGLDLTLKHAPARNHTGHPWTFQNEWLQKSTGSVEEQEGWYSSLQYKLGGSYWVGVRSERTIRVPIPDSTVDERRQTLEIVWAPGEFTVIRADYSYGTMDSGGDRALDRRALIQFVHTIGTHPAHNF